MEVSLGKKNLSFIKCVIDESLKNAKYKVILCPLKCQNRFLFVYFYHSFRITCIFY